MNKDLYFKLEDLSKLLRKNCLKMALGVGPSGSHLGGGLSLVEVFAVLYGGVINVNAENPQDPDRDRIVVSKGHCVLSYYSVLNKFGFISDEDLALFETNGAILHGHATRDVTRGIEFSGGSLGLGISYSIGVAIAAKIKGKSYNVFTIVGDGELNEGIVWEALMSASHFKLDNLTVIVDNNKLQYDGDPKDIMNMGSLRNKFEAFGFDVIEVDGHSVTELFEAFQVCVSEKPKAIIANTVKGKGVSFMENNKAWHHSTLSQEQFDAAIAEQDKLFNIV